MARSCGGAVGSFLLLSLACSREDSNPVATRVLGWLLAMEARSMGTSRILSQPAPRGKLPAALCSARPKMQDRSRKDQASGSFDETAMYRPAMRIERRV